jgi:hypothetical protein
MSLIGTGLSILTTLPDGYAPIRGCFGVVVCAVLSATKRLTGAAACLPQMFAVMQGSRFVPGKAV